MSDEGNAAGTVSHGKIMLDPYQAQALLEANR